MALNAGASAVYVASIKRKGYIMGWYIKDFGGRVTIRHSHGFEVAKLNQSISSFEANARLIAAAPELLAQLEKAVYTIQGEWPKEQWAEQGVPAMQAAIKKAKGEQ